MTSRSTLLDTNEWQAPSGVDAVASLRQLISSHCPRSVWTNDGRLSPLDLYCYLKARFGQPNGPSMALKAPHADNLIHWEFALAVGEHLLLVQGNVHSVVFILIGPERVAEDQWCEVAEAVKADFKNYGSQMSAVRKDLEKWILFTNPYHRLDRVIQALESRLRELNLSEPPLSPHIGKKVKIRNVQERTQHWIRQVNECHLLATATRMLAPVLGEAFINLLIFLLARPDVRDPRVYEDFIRKQVDIRIKTLHLHCSEFTKAVETSSKCFGDFHSVMNSRNDFLHGNVDPLKLQFGDVQFDGMIPLFKDEDSTLRRFVRNSLKGVSREEALADIAAVRAFIAFLLQHLTSNGRKTVEVAMERGELGWREDYRRVGILFPAAVPDFVGIK